MCRTAYYDHPLCGCRWLAIAQPCGPGMGFSTCPSFFSGYATRAGYGSGSSGYGTSALKPSVWELFTGRDTHRERQAEHAWSAVPCPVHTLGGVYDRNYVRRILDVQNGMRLGTGPDPQDFGLECRCDVM
ncbi:uncharacterized protein SPSK_00934 [Sporothrix schenckii 1099-18]|uniref:Uncharacterized protein n=2 Tax=Sporothrix schenckii TaxID=29908 RepID=U7PK42_SPOS1|nr:uncharacterized protein SPSK_00934 [Sporothrix schenckii 1099-18]ERS96013.1 hypothetical protein HMPREF1624_07549 [Sporothrix schenckii ATCC 58251]KJR81726.1 hypothetical protein SPSK_00934 [Sporothrix schenckii 1099-18]